MNSLTYRTATQADLKALQDLGLIAYAQFKNIISDESWQQWQMGFHDDKNFLHLLDIGICFICEDGNKIVGMAFLIPNGNPYAYFEAAWSYIRYVATHPDYEGNGIGRKLTQYCIDAARSSEEKIIALHTSTFQNAARHIYESLGFIRIKELAPTLGNQYYLYTLEL